MHNKISRKASSFILMFLFLVIGSLTKAQQQFGLRAGLGFSSIETKSNDDMQSAPQLSFDFGVFTSIKLGKYSYSGAELNISRIQGRQNSQIQLMDANNEIHDVDITFLQHITYASLPVYYTHVLGKLSLNLGFQTSLVLFSDGHRQGQKLNFFQEVENYNTDYDELDIKSLDFGPRAGLTFRLSDSFLLEAKYYYGLNNILKHHNNEYYWKIRQATVGMRYIFPKSGTN